jgi:hypothetical protein
VGGRSGVGVESVKEGRKEGRKEGKTVSKSVFFSSSNASTAESIPTYDIIRLLRRPILINQIRHGRLRFVERFKAVFEHGFVLVLVEESFALTEHLVLTEVGGEELRRGDRGMGWK